MIITSADVQNTVQIERMNCEADLAKRMVSQQTEFDLHLDMDGLKSIFHLNGYVFFLVHCFERLWTVSQTLSVY
jgi:hypothetical protein